MIFCTRESTEKHDLCTKEYIQNNVRPKYKDILFLTVTAIRTDSSHTQICTNRYLQGTRTGKETLSKRPALCQVEAAPACSLPAWPSRLSLFRSLRFVFMGVLYVTLLHMLYSHEGQAMSRDVLCVKEVGKQSSELRMTFTWWRAVWDFTSHNNTFHEGWCETVVWDLTSHNNTLNEGWCETVVWESIHSMKGGVRL